MKREEAIEILRSAWFVSLDGKHTPMDARNALRKALACLRDNKALSARVEHYKGLYANIYARRDEAVAEARRAKEENGVLALENEALRAELAKQTKALKTIFGHIAIEDFASDKESVAMVVRLTRDEYIANVDPLERDERYHEGEDK